MTVPALIASNGSLLDNTLDGRVTEVRVEQYASEPASFSIRFADDILGGQPAVAGDEAVQPGRIVTIVASTGEGLQCLVHGPIEQHKVRLQHGGSGSWVEVRGRDRRSELSRTCTTTVWTKTSAANVIRAILGSYGIGAEVPTDGPVAAARLTFHQRDTDLGFIDELLQRFGLELWLDVRAKQTITGLRVEETAHIACGSPPATTGGSGGLAHLASGPAVLRMNSESEPTITSLAIDVDVDRAGSAAGSGYNDRTGRVERFSVATPPPGSDTGLAALSDAEVCVVGAGTVADLRLRSEARLREASWFVRATTSTTTDLVGRALAPHDAVTIAGAGRTHSGDYEIEDAVHVLTAASHLMDLTLRRNWLGT